MATPIRVESHGGANVARVVAAPIASGQSVKADDIIFEIESHKVVQEMTAPRDGVLVHRLSAGDYVEPGDPIAYLADLGEDVAGLRPQTAGASLAERWEAAVDGHGAAAPPAQGDPVPVRKATEIAILSNGAGNSMLSCLGAAIGPVPRAPSTADFFATKILDLVAFEAARLLAGEYKILNARFDRGRIVPNDGVRAGVAFDDGARLTLYVVEDADRLSLPDLQDEIVGGLMRYVGQALEPSQVATSTFTISDLSASQLTFSLPLVPRDQCIIIAITRAEGGDYSLFVSFDHRVTEGMVAAAFTTELVARIRSFAHTSSDTAAAAAVEAPATELACTFCFKTLEEEVSIIGGKGLMRIVDASGQDALCCSACWGGW